MNGAPTPLFSPLPPPPPPWFDRASFEATLGEVDRAALAVRTLFHEERVSYLRADVFFLALLAASLATSAGPLFNYGWLGFWLLPAVFLTLALSLALFPASWESAISRVGSGGWALDPVETGSPTSDLSRPVRVLGRMWKDWEGLQMYSIMTVLFLAAACFAASEVAFSLLSAAVHPSTLATTRVLLYTTTAAVVIPGLVAVALWARKHRARLEPIRSLLFSANARFRELEQTFWRRY